MLMAGAESPPPHPKFIFIVAISKHSCWKGEDAPSVWRASFGDSISTIARWQTQRPCVHSKRHQVETARGKRVETNLKFSDEGVSGSRLESNHATPALKDFTMENLYDLHSAFLYLRSQPLRDRSVYRVAVYPANSAYVATLTVVGREHVRVRAGNYNAIKVDLKLQRVNKKNELEPHRKFKRATIWLSDDNDRRAPANREPDFCGHRSPPNYSRFASKTVSESIRRAPAVPPREQYADAVFPSEGGRADPAISRVQPAYPCRAGHWGEYPGATGMRAAKIPNSV